MNTTKDGRGNGDEDSFLPWVEYWRSLTNRKLKVGFVWNKKPAHKDLMEQTLSVISVIHLFYINPGMEELRLSGQPFSLSFMHHLNVEFTNFHLLSYVTVPSWGSYRKVTQRLLDRKLDFRLSTFSYRPGYIHIPLKNRLPCCIRFRDFIISQTLVFLRSHILISSLHKPNLYV